jgi:RNA-directed DNA polymerase
MNTLNNYFEKQLLYDLFQAYYDARKHKRSTTNALAFEIDYETKLFKLYEEIKNEKYEINPSICFINFLPTKREIFAGDFRDRIVHHLIYNYINSFFERLFINDAYSCRKGKGTSYGIKRVDHFIRSCSENYKKDCYILKLDIKGYFMSIDKNILYKKVKNTLNHFRERANFDVDFILRLVHKIIFHDHVKNCIIKGRREDWAGLPKSKSLFYASKDKGLPIGNLTSQLFGNVYLNEFDNFFKYKLGCKYYGRYVDDMVIIHKDKEYLKSVILILKQKLFEMTFLELHPKKIYLQHFSKGVAFLGTIIKPYRIYVKNRIKGNFYKKIFYWNDFFEKSKYKFSKVAGRNFLASINSYLGIMACHNTYKLRKNILENWLGGGLRAGF